MKIGNIQLPTRLSERWGWDTGIKNYLKTKINCNMADGGGGRGGKGVHKIDPLTLNYTIYIKQNVID